MTQIAYSSSSRVSPLPAYSALNTLALSVCSRKAGPACEQMSAERLMAVWLTRLVVPAGHNVVQEGDDVNALFLTWEGVC